MLQVAGAETSPDGVSVDKKAEQQLGTGTMLRPQPAGAVRFRALRVESLDDFDKRNPREGGAAGAHDRLMVGISKFMSVIIRWKSAHVVKVFCGANRVRLISATLIICRVKFLRGR